MLGAALGLAVSKQALLSSYVFTFAILMTVMTNVCQYFATRRPPGGSCWARWGPTLLMATATVLILVSPLKNLVVNVCMTSFRLNGFDSTIEKALDFAYLPIFGERPMQAYTACAYVFMFWGTAMQVDLQGKFLTAFRSFKGKSAPPAGG